MTDLITGPTVPIAVPMILMERIELLTAYRPCVLFEAGDSYEHQSILQLS